jgi:diguanylate cyclase (GGDEF)-like protein
VTHSDDSNASRAQLQRLREEHEKISGLLGCIQELTRSAINLQSVADLISAAFRTLFRCVQFDIGVAVILEQHLDLYVMTRQGEKGLVSEKLVERIRDSLRSLVAATFGTTEMVVMGEASELPALPQPADSLAHERHALLQLENRTAGVILLYASEPFSTDDQELLEIYSTQVSMLLASLRARERIVNLAETDDLTGIWNRRYFRRRLPQELERARVYSVPMSLLIIDVDDFKQINDTFGHTVGDVVLSELCGAVRETLRPPDLFARFGGDEFAIILPHTDLDGARAVADRILDRVRTLLIETDDGTIRCSISIGVTDFRPAVDATADDIIRRTDERLYQSKRSGKNRYTA